MPPQTGKKAPAFTLEDRENKKVSLKNFKGQWAIVYFYPKDNTPGCTTEACEFSASLPDFSSADAAVIGISPDSVASHGKFSDKFDLKHILLSDPDHTAAEAYGAWGKKKNYGKEYFGIIRSTFLIDPEGKIAYMWPKVKATGHAAEVLNKIKEITKP